jgi:hypothetical protein
MVAAFWRCFLVVLRKLCLELVSLTCVIVTALRSPSRARSCENVCQDMIEQLQHKKTRSNCMYNPSHYILSILSVLRC